MPYIDQEEVVSEQVGALPKTTAISSVGIFGILLGATMLAPLFPNQFISGPMVNALLIIVTIMLGWRSGLIMCFVPSIMAYIGGLLPPLFLPFMPFIMLSNVIFVTLVHYIRLRNYWLATGVASVTKFIFLTIASQLFFNLIMNQALAKPAALMMSWFQLYSAVAGSVIAYIFLKIIKRI